MKKLALGNYAVARGAFEAGARVGTAYPGTPSTEITEFLSDYDNINVEWSPNEKVALEVAVGASVAGARSLCCMKHVGLNVAADPLFTASYSGVNGGLVIVVADDPGMFSSQNEQDTRYYAKSAHIPLLEPSDSQECLDFTKLAFEISEKYDTPVILRLTTRVAHSQSFISENSKTEIIGLKEYKKDPAKYVMMPGNAIKRHVVVEQRMDKLSKDVNLLEINKFTIKDKKLGIITAGNVVNYALEALPDASIFKIGSVHPLPIEKIREFALKVDRLVVVEELEPYIEDSLKAAGINCDGKNLFSKQGELSVHKITDKIYGSKPPSPVEGLPPRPPVMCAGCPHRGVFYNLSRQKLNVFGDIGCYTLGALPPLTSIDAVLCMGASIGMAIGWEKVHGFDRKTIAVIGDSTFVHSGITGLIDAVYNRLNTKIVVLDNGTTGMTGHQPNPTTGRDIRNQQTHALCIEDVAAACGVKNITTVDAYDLEAVNAALKTELSRDGVSVIVCRRICKLIDKQAQKSKTIDRDKCVNCKMCLKLGCPAIEVVDGKPKTTGQCTGCGVCVQTCKTCAIK